MIILVTGASSGIGKVTAELLAQRGHRVYGTYRTHQPASSSFEPLYLDVNDVDSVNSVIATILQREGRLDALVNNAGWGIAGAVELTSADEAAAQMATNYLGALNVVRAAMPALRQSGGRIVSTSSLAAVIPIPFQSMYSASKAALEITMHALMLEARPYGVRSTCVELSDTRTEFTQHRKRTAASQGDTIYGARFEQSIAKMEQDERTGYPPEKAARCIVRQIERRNPPPIAVCGGVPKLIYALQKILPRRLLLRIVGGLYAPCSAQKTSASSNSVQKN